MARISGNDREMVIQVEQRLDSAANEILVRNLTECTEVRGGDPLQDRWNPGGCYGDRGGSVCCHGYKLDELFSCGRYLNLSKMCTNATLG